MIEKKILKKAIKEFFAPFAKQNGFFYLKPTLLVREHMDTLHIINFDIPHFGYNCDVAIQPLYIPQEDIVLGLGNRLEHFKEVSKGRWGFCENENELEQGLIQVQKLLEKNVLPWFNEVGTPQGIVSFIERGYCKDVKLIVGFPPFLENLYLGFSYLYCNNFDLADKAFDIVTKELEGDSNPWIIQMVNLLHNIKVLLHSEPEKIHILLNTFIEQTKRNLKIPT